MASARIQTRMAKHTKQEAAQRLARLHEQHDRLLGHERMQPLRSTAVAARAAVAARRRAGGAAGGGAAIRRGRRVLRRRGRRRGRGGRRRGGRRAGGGRGRGRRGERLVHGGAQRAVRRQLVHDVAAAQQLAAGVQLRGAPG